MSRYPSIFTTPEAVILQLEKANPSVTPNPSNAAYADFFAFITVTCRDASQYIVSQTDRTFVPYLDNRPYFHSDLYASDSLRGGQMYMGEDLLVASAVTWEGGDLSTEIVSPTYYRFLPVNTMPSIGILFNGRYVPSFSPSDFNATTTISGWWGYHTNLSAAYTVMQASFTCTDIQTALIVTTGTAHNYETLQYLRCENELMLITAINTTLGILTVERGVNGTTALAHTSKALSRWNVMPDMALCATRLVSFLYSRRNDIGSIQYADGSTLIDKLPTAVIETMRFYERRVWTVA